MASADSLNLVSIERFSPLSLGQRQFDAEDGANPAASEAVSRFNSLCTKILNHPEVQKSLAHLGPNFTVEVEISKEEGVKVLKPGRLYGFTEVFSSKTLLIDEDWLDLSKTHTLVQSKGIGKQVPESPSRKDKLESGWKALRPAEKVFGDINSELGSLLSVVRNFSRAANPNLVMLPMMTSIGGGMAIVAGVWFSLMSLKDLLVAICRGDWQGAGEALLFMISMAGLICMGVSMIIVMDIIFDMTLGCLFYGALGIWAIIRLVKDSYFRHQMNTKLEGASSEAIAKTLAWLKEQAKANPAEFERRVGQESARRIMNEVNDELIKGLKTNELHMKHALYLIEETSKNNLTNIYAGSLDIIISILGILSCVLPGVKTPAILFGTGAVCWLAASDMKLPDAKKHIMNGIWAANKKCNSTWKKINELQKSSCPTPPSETFSTISALSGDSLATA